LFSYTSASADSKGFAGAVLRVEDEEVDSRKLKAKNRTEAGYVGRRIYRFTQLESGLVALSRVVFYAVIIPRAMA
jgi:hypothetical protein